MLEVKNSQLIRYIMLLSMLLIYEICASQSLDSTYHSELPDVPIIAEQPSASKVPMFQREYKRTPAAFGDPVRVLVKYPGFTMSNDGANAINYRGMPNNANQWQMYGADIVNPNHLSNAGMSNDRMNYNSGGTLAFSSAVLGDFSFYGQPSSVKHGNTPGGVMDLSLATSTKSFYEFSLLGFEGGLNLTRKKVNTIVSVRNSFVGILSALGTDFGGEKINFSDATINSHYNWVNGKSINAFASFGFSSNIRVHLSENDEIADQRDIQDITYRGNHGIFGLHFKQSYQGFKTSLTVISSIRNESRKSNIAPVYQNKYGGLIASADQSFADKFPFSLNYTVQKTKNRHQFGGGLRSSLQVYQIFVVKNVLSVLPYVEYVYSFSNALNASKLTSSVSYEFNNLNLRSKLPSYQVGFETHLVKNLSFSASYSRITPKRLIPFIINTDFRTHNVELQLKYIKDRLRIFVTPFSHVWRGSPGYAGFLAGPISNHSLDGTISLFDDLLIDGSSAASHNLAGRSRGVSTSVANIFSIGEKKSLDVSYNATWFSSEIESLDKSIALWAPSRLNTRYVHNANMYYNVMLSSRKSILIGINYHIRGGEYIPSSFINPSAAHFEAYQRFDLKVAYYYPSKNRHMHRWSLDIQNLTNRQNDGYLGFDVVLNSTVKYPQLGLIPVLSYRYEY
jgi:hypothetical protein